MQVAQPEPAKTLYERLGRYDGIATIVDEFLGRLRADPMFARFGGGRSLDSTQRGREFLVSQMCELSGGPCKYFGRDMKAAHSGLGITGAEWEACMRHTADAIDHLKVGAREKDEFLALFERYRAEIVQA